LTVVDPSAVAGIPLKNLPNSVSFFADVGNGDVILVTTAADDYTHAGFQLYYGEKSAVRERTITNIGQGLDIHSGPTVTFLVDSVEYTVSYGGLIPADAGARHGTINMQNGNAVAYTERSDDPISFDGLTFICSGS
jgi:hypothetical protein